MEKIDPELLKSMMMGDYAATGKKESSEIQKHTKSNAREIDLHASRLFRQLPPRNEILTAQIAALRDFLSKAINAGVSSIVIIHGKGEAILIQEVHKVLKANQAVKSFQVLYDIPHQGGATRAHFR